MTKRMQLLQKAADLTSDERNKTYGNPRTNHSRIAAIMTVLLDKKLAPGEVITPSEAALLMIAVKLSRLVESPGHEDSYVDGAAYFAIAGEIYGS